MKLSERFSPKGWLFFQLGIGIAVVFLSVVAFADVARVSGADQPMFALDRQTVEWFHARATPLLTFLALGASILGSVRFLTLASLTGLLVFWRRKRWNRLLVLVLAMGGESVLNIALKHEFHRQRPALENPLVTLSSYGFPSGHTMGATVFYGLIALIVTHEISGWKRRAAVAVGATLVILTVGLSRIYLGAHFLSDVLGAIAAGVAWLMFCWTGLETIRRRRRLRATTAAT